MLAIVAAILATIFAAISSAISRQSQIASSLHGWFEIANKMAKIAAKIANVNGPLLDIQVGSKAVFYKPCSILVSSQDKQKYKGRVKIYSSTTCLNV